VTDVPAATATSSGQRSLASVGLLAMAASIQFHPLEVPRYLTEIHIVLPYRVFSAWFLVILSFTHFYGRAAAELSFSDLVLRTFTRTMKTVISYNNLELYLYHYLYTGQVFHVKL
jgi:hypothetical protein